VTGGQLLEQWRGRSDPLSRNDAYELASAMDAAGFCFEPDVRFSGHVLRPADSVVLYPCAERQGVPSAAYLAAATIARLGVIVASADGAVVSEEQTLLRERTSKAIALTQAEGRRLDAYVDWLLDTPIALDALQGEGAGVQDSDRIRIGRFLVAVAGADGYISTPERWMLAGTFGLFGLTAEQLEAEIASFTASHGSTRQPDSDVGVASGLDLEAVETIHFSPATVQEALRESGTAIASLAGLMPVAPVAPLKQTLHLVSEVVADSGPRGMSNWEAGFAEEWGRLTADERRRPGSLLALVPPRARWEEFIASWKASPLAYWLAHKSDYPHAVAVLFGGFAFFEYNETSFWPQFEHDLWSLTVTQKVAIRSAHIAALDRLGLELTRNQADDRMTVASAVHHIGVPLSIWADFLGVADHVLRQADWTSWPSEHWQSDVTARCGPHIRLRNFLTANEATARATIAELGEIRDFANADPTSTIEDLSGVANVPFLRDEYFDDVPETAEFFRPDNLLSLFAGRCFVRYDDENSRLQVHLPAVPDAAGSTWRVGDHEQAAGREPAWFTIDGDGFARWIDVHLDGPSGRRTRRVAGIAEWGLYDQRREAFLELDLRHPSERRMGDYLLVSPRPLTHMTRSGFLRDFLENQVERLADGTRCYVTRLSPAAREGSLAIRWITSDGELRAHTITFRTHLTLRGRTMFINGVERPMGDPSLPWYFLRPGPYPPISYAALTAMELTKMNNQGSASAYARLRRYTEEGVIAARADGAWRLDHQRARVRRIGDIVEVSLLGLPSRMWALGKPLSIEIVGDGGLTYLRGTWPATHEPSIRETLGRYDIAVVSA
jgi:hypothetical protein